MLFHVPISRTGKEHKLGNPSVLIPLSSISCFHIQIEPLGNTPSCPCSKTRPMLPHCLMVETSELLGCGQYAGPEQTFTDCFSQCPINMVFSGTSWGKSLHDVEQLGKLAWVKQMTGKTIPALRSPPHRPGQPYIPGHRRLFSQLRANTTVWSCEAEEGNVREGGNCH